MRKQICLLIFLFSILFVTPVMAGNYIFMGDSYSSSEYSWPEMVIEKLNIPQSNIGYCKNSGAGIAKYVNSFYTNLDCRDYYSGRINTLYQKSKAWNNNVTRIIIQGGTLNDYLKQSGPSTQETVFAFMKQLNNELKKRYPNAKILYASTNWCAESMVKNRKAEVLSALARTEEYARLVKKIGWYHMANAEYSLRLSPSVITKYFASDGIHPNNAGKRLIANAMVKDIKLFEEQEQKRVAATKQKKVAITKMNALKVTNTEITLNINSDPEGVKYVLYGGKVGEKFKKIATLYTNRSVRKNLKKGTYYNYQVIAYNAAGKEIAKSRKLYIATKGGKYTNVCDMTVPTSYVSLKKGQTYKIYPTKILLEKDKTEKVYQEYTYVSDTPGVASVSNSGVITAKYQGTAIIHVIAQSGASRRITVKVP